MKEEILKLLSLFSESSDFYFNDLEEYVDKIIEKAVIQYVMKGNKIIAFIAYYDNDLNKNNAYLTMLLVNHEYRGKGYGKALLNSSIETLRFQGFVNYTLEVKKNNYQAIKLYQDFGFKESKEMEESLLMTKIL